MEIAIFFPLSALGYDSVFLQTSGFSNSFLANGDTGPNYVRSLASGIDVPGFFMKLWPAESSPSEMILHTINLACECISIE
jgi:hypothetical protein